MSNSAIALLEDRVLVKPDKGGETKTEGGLIVPESARGTTLKDGTVAFVGPGKRALNDGRRMEPAIKPGDRVIYEGFGAKELKHDGVTYQECREADIVAVVK